MKNIITFFLFFILIFYSIPSPFSASFQNFEEIRYNNENILERFIEDEYQLIIFNLIDLFLYLFNWNNLEDNSFNLNEPPSTPIIDGPDLCRVGDIYNYSFCSTDPENNDIYYLIHWGDGNVFYWIGPFKSGVKVNFSYCWIGNPRMNDNFIIEAMAKDVHDAKSDWGYLEIVMPCDEYFKINCLKS